MPLVPLPSHEASEADHAGEGDEERPPKAFRQAFLLDGAKAALPRLPSARADTKRTHQKRHARRLATHRWHPNHADCRRNRVASDRVCTRVTPQNLHGKEGVDGSSPSEGSWVKALQIGL